MALISDRFTHIYVLDTEFVAPDAERQRPVSVCAKGFRKAREVRAFLDKPVECPFVGLESATTLFVGYNLSAEYKCFIELGWPLPKHSIDLMFEYKNLTCGVWRGKESLWQIGWGLEAALRELGGNPAQYWTISKDEMHAYISAHGTQAPEGVTPEAHAEKILVYNMEDCIATHFCAQGIMSDPAYDEDQALHRGRFAVATAFFEENGLPVDVERYSTVVANHKKLQVHIAQEIERQHRYGVFVIEGREDLKNKPHPVFKMKNFSALLDRIGVTVGKRAMWDATDSGQPYLDDDYFGGMCSIYPELQPLRQARKTVKSLGLLNSTVGSDGMNRYALFPFGTVTSRNNPKATQFLLSRPHWLRMLMRPKPGYAIVSADISGAEDWLAAGYSGDPELMRIYSSGADGYIEFAVVTGAVPSGTVRDKSNPDLEKIRAQHKIAKLAIAYGVKENTLSKQLGVPVWKAAFILNAHREHYNVYWRWTEDQAALARKRGYVSTDFGWRQDVRHMSENSVLNYPQQSGCAEVLRLACNLLLDEGWGFAFSAPHHDALYLHVPVERADECARAVEAAFVEAGKLVMGSAKDPDFAERFPLKIKAKVTRYPDHYVDPDGKGIWDIVCEYFKWDGFKEEAINVEDSSETRDSVPAVQGLYQGGAMDRAA